MTTWERVLKLEKVFKLEETRMKWVPVVAEMGTVPDRVIAKKLACAPEYVAQVRQKMGIAPKNFPKHCKRYGALYPAPRQDAANIAA